MTIAAVCPRCGVMGGCICHTSITLPPMIPSPPGTPEVTVLPTSPSAAYAQGWREGWLAAWKEATTVRAQEAREVALQETVEVAEALERVRAEAYLSGWVNGSNGVEPPDFGNPVFEKAPGD